MTAKDLALHLASISNAQEAAEALVVGVAEMTDGITTQTDRRNMVSDLRNNVAALAGSIFWGTPQQGGMARPQPVGPPWERFAPGPAADEGVVQKTSPAASPGVPGAHLAVEPAVEDAAGDPEATDDEYAHQEAAEAEEPENGPVDWPARAKPKPKPQHAMRGA
jgi:hypothetical protein